MSDSCKDSAGWKAEKQISYYDDATIAVADDYIKERCYLNIEYPSNRDGFATMIYFHGGGLRTGEPDVIEENRYKNFAAVAAGYRLAPKAKCINCIEDAAAAAAWVIKNIARYGGNPNKVFLMGSSGGAYLAAMIGMDDRYLAKYDLKPQHFAGVISVSGQLTTHLTVKKEAKIPFVRPIIDEFAPLYHVASNLPPFLVVCGDRNLDMPSRMEENAFFAACMKAAGHTKTEFHEVQGLSHCNIHNGVALHICTFIDKICGEIDKAGLPATKLAEPNVLPTMAAQIEAVFDSGFTEPWPSDD